MFNKKFAAFLAIGGLNFALACGGEENGDDDGSPTGAGTMNAESGGNEESGGSDNAETGGAESTGGQDGSTGGGECAPTDQCQEDADCGTGSCVGCICVGGEDTGGTPTNSDYGPCTAACAAGEQPIGLEGIDGCFCSPGCDGMGSMCPAPNEGTAMAQCALSTAMGAPPSQCALICIVDQGDGQCPTGATCEFVQEQMGVMIGICMHPVPGGGESSSGGGGEESSTGA